MITYFDTNVLIYAFAKNIDNIKQSILSTNLVEEAIEKDTLIVSEITLYEFAFVSHKIKEEKQNIDDNLEFLYTFLKDSSINITQRVLNILKNRSLYNSSFDIYHLAFAEYYNAKLITYDKGFKKLKDDSKVLIEIL